MTAHHVRVVVSALMVPLGVMGGAVGSAFLLALTLTMGLALWATHR